MTTETVACDICGKPCKPVGMPPLCDECWDQLEDDAEISSDQFDARNEAYSD